MTSLYSKTFRKSPKTCYYRKSAELWQKPVTTVQKIFLVNRTQLTLWTSGKDPLITGKGKPQPNP